MILGVLGGSGLYDLEGLADVQEHAVSTPFGEPSGPVVAGRLGDARLLFLPRHGRGHALPPTAINARANIDALKRAGCTDVVSIAAVGSLREALAPGAFVIVDQFIDRTVAREASFFGPGLAAHVSMGDPVCRRLSGYAAVAARALGFAMTSDPALHLMVGGRTVRPRMYGRRYLFRLPAASSGIRLLSRSAAPAHTHADGIDQNQLGYPLRILFRETRRHPPAHRVARDRKSRERQPFRDPCHDVRHRLFGIVAGRYCAGEAMAGHVDRDDAECI